jgi:AcrR family transcriptional regulator
MAGNSHNPEIWRKQPKQGRSANTVQSILQAAERLFTTQGYEATTAEDIVLRAGVGIGSLYDYFPNKKAVALALLESLSGEIAEDSRRLFVEHGREPIEVSLPKLVRKIYHSYKRHKNVLINLVNEVPALRSAAEMYSIDKLIYRASLMYLQIYQEQFDERTLERDHSFLNLVFTASMKQYLSEAVHLIDEDEFLERLSAIILLTLLQGSTPKTGSIVPLRPAS